MAAPLADDLLLVTGATGFVGRAVVRLAVERGQRVRAMVHRRQASFPSEVEVSEADLGSAGSLATVLKGVSRIVHAAALVANVKEPSAGEYLRVNRHGMENLVAAARIARVGRIVLISGLGTKPAPAGSYMATRYAMEQAVLSSGLESVILRPSILFGPGAPFVEALDGLVRRLPVVPLIAAQLRFQPLHVDDLARCALESLDRPELAGQEVELGGPEILTMRDMVSTLCRRRGVRRLLVPVPRWAARLQAHALGAVLERPPLTPASMELFEFDNVTDLDSVSRHFGFEPRAFGGSG